MELKRILIIIVTVLLTVILFIAAGSPGPGIQFERTKADFGTIAANGGPVTFGYKFTNTGNKPLLIISVTNGGCGCTKPDFPREPIAPGKSGEVKIHFNPEGRSGQVNREVRVRTNIEGQSTVKLRFSGKVKK